MEKTISIWQGQSTKQLSYYSGATPSRQIFMSVGMFSIDLCPTDHTQGTRIISNRSGTAKRISAGKETQQEEIILDTWMC